ncbi:hypothetical protein MRX96_025913 [Rhipicephalus microplus]
MDSLGGNLRNLNGHEVARGLIDRVTPDFPSTLHLEYRDQLFDFDEITKDFYLDRGAAMIVASTGVRKIPAVSSKHAEKPSRCRSSLRGLSHSKPPVIATCASELEIAGQWT